MFTLYLFALIVGGGLLLFSLFGGSEGHDVDTHGDAAAHAGDAGQWLTLRTAIYFLFVFGGVGAVLSKSWHSAATPLVLALALAAGVGVGAVVAAAFKYLRTTDSGLRESDDSFIGLSGRMVLPFGATGSGKVLVTRGDRTFELLARPFEGSSGDPASWRAVVVLEMKRGSAVVAPANDPAVREISSFNP
jgi:hypothetical protein